MLRLTVAILIIFSLVSTFGLIWSTMLESAGGLSQELIAPNLTVSVATLGGFATLNALTSVGLFIVIRRLPRSSKGVA